MTKRIRTFLLAATLLVVTACSAEKPPAAPAVAPEAPRQEGPAAQCLALASAKRERPAKEPDRISVRHILVKYAGAKKAPASITRTREEACLRAIEARDKVRGGADFVEVVTQYSEEPGAASRGGLLPDVERKSLVPPFADAAFELELNQMSDVVETDFGFHVILRTQ
jgi:parvulin-like peptidyl-prolyl isomerase